MGTGVAVALPEGYAGFVHPRSGLAARHGISIVNAPGTVDAGYRGEILVCLVNTDTATAVRISRGDRIAQLVVQRVARARFVAVPQLPDPTDTAGRTGAPVVTGPPVAWPPAPPPTRSSNKRECVMIFRRRRKDDEVPVDEVDESTESETTADSDEPSRGGVVGLGLR